MTPTTSTAAGFDQRVRDSLAAVEDLAGAEPAFAEFFERLATILAAALDPAVVGVWVVDERNGVHLAADTGLKQSSCFERLEFIRWNQQAVLGALRAATPQVVPAPANWELPGQSALLVPILFEDGAVGVIEIVGGPLPDKADGDDRWAALDELLGVVRQYLADLKSAALDSSAAAATTEYRDFALRLHRSLCRREVALTAVNDLRVFINCDRVTLLERTGRRYRVRAVSGQSRFNPRSNQLRLLCQLAACAMRAGERFAFDGRTTGQPQSVARPLAAYLGESAAQALVLEPVSPSRPDPDARLARPSSRRRHAIEAVLVCEQFRDSRWRPHAFRRLATFSEHVGLAWHNAGRHERQSIPGIRELAATLRWLRGRRLALVATVCLLLAGIVTALATVPGTLIIHCDGRLMPIERRTVFAPMEGEIADVHVRGEATVAVGDPLFTLHNRQLEADLLAERSRMQQHAASRQAVQTELHDSSRASSREHLLELQARIQELTVQIDACQQRLRVLEHQDERRTVRAAIAGTVILSKAEHELIGRPVRSGEPLLEIMDETGPWRLELAVPERHVGHVLNARRGDVPVPVNFRLAARIDDVRATTLTSVEAHTSVTPQDGSVVLAYANVSHDNLPQQRIGAEATAQLECGQRSLLFIWFGDVQAYLASRWWM